MNDDEIDGSLPNYDDYKVSLVAFIDILGFDNKAKNINNQKDFLEVSKLLYATQKTAENISNADDILKDFEFTAISDSVIASVPFTDPICTVGMLQILHGMQYELLGTDFKTIIRGYITKGHVHHKNGLIFGPGYSNAIKGERLVGGAPRVVLDPNLVDEARRVICSNQSDTKKYHCFQLPERGLCRRPLFHRLSKTGWQTIDSTKRPTKSRKRID